MEHSVSLRRPSVAGSSIPSAGKMQCLQCVAMAGSSEHVVRNATIRNNHFYVWLVLDSFVTFCGHAFQQHITSRDAAVCHKARDA